MLIFPCKNSQNASKNAFFCQNILSVQKKAVLLQPLFGKNSWLTPFGRKPTECLRTEEAG